MHCDKESEDERRDVLHWSMYAHKVPDTLQMSDCLAAGFGDCDTRSVHLELIHNMAFTEACSALFEHIVMAADVRVEPVFESIMNSATAMIHLYSNTVHAVGQRSPKIVGLIHA